MTTPTTLAALPSFESGAPNVTGQTAMVVARPYDPTPVNQSAEADEKLHKKALEHFNIVVTAEKEWREKAAKELRFCDLVDHWGEDRKRERGSKPSLEFDLIGPAVDQVVNNMRQNPPEPRVAGVGGGADKATADVCMGILRNIDNDSASEIAWTYAYELAVKIGRGWVKAEFVYEDDDENPFYQKILLRRVANWASIYPDPNAVAFDFTDMRYCFETETLDEDTFKHENPGATVPVRSEFESKDDPVIADWFPKGGVRVAYYWHTKDTKETVYQTADGRIYIDDLPEGVEWRNKRERTKTKLYRAKMTGVEILKLEEYPIAFIPLVPVLGRETWIEGKQKLRGMIRSMVDANLAYDYARSKGAEQLTLGTISQWLASVEAIEGFEADYASSNTTDIAVLKWHNKDNDGNQLAQPQRISPAPASQAIEVAIQHADMDVKATSSMYNPSLGAPDSAESSGKAILARQRQGDNAHFNYADNLARAVRHMTRIELALFPFVYSEERELSIADPDGTQHLIKINQKFVDPKTGKSKIFEINKSTLRYHVTIGSGPSYASRKAFQTDVMMQMFQAAPGPMSRALDLILRYVDAPQDIIDRMRPQDIAQSQDQAEGEGPTVQEMQQSLQQSKALIDKLMAAVQQMNAELKGKKLELDSKERMNARDNATRLTTVALQTKSSEALKELELEYARITTTLDRLEASSSASAPGADEQEPASGPAVQSPAAGPDAGSPQPPAPAEGAQPPMPADAGAQPPVQG